MNEKNVCCDYITTDKMVQFPEERIYQKTKASVQDEARKDVELYIKLHIANHRPG